MIGSVLALDFSSAVSRIFSEGGFWPAFQGNVGPLLLLVVSLAVYCILVWHFYRVISRRDIFPLNFAKAPSDDLYSYVINFCLGLLEYMLLYPVLCVFFFLGYGAIFLFLSKSLPLGAVLLTSFSLIGTIRITAYYKEDLAQDVAKFFPLSILGIFLADPGFFSVADSFAKIGSGGQFLGPILHYVLFLLFLEWVLRLAYSGYVYFTTGRPKVRSLETGPKIP